MTEVLPLEVDRAVKAFGDTVAVGGVTISLDHREIIAVVGPSGCGKSTLLRAIGGLESLDDGSIRLAGLVVDDGDTRVPPERRSVGLVFQEHALFPHLTVHANVSFGLRGRPRAEVDDRVDEMLGVVSLAGYEGRYPHELSGGERQRVALARALAPSPALMLFDEPFASLDRNLRDELRRHVVSALRATGTAALIVTHDQHEALAIGDRVAVMRSGRLVQADSPDAVFHSPADEFVAAFLGEASFLPIENGDGTAVSVLGPVPGASSTTHRAMVRPDDIELTDEHEGVEGEITEVEYRGTHWFVDVRLDHGISVGALAPHLDRPEIGDRRRVRLVAGHAQVPVEPVD
ncbi:MAG: ABC transporter ATP-binding protein [Actinomycetota bacterium]